MGRKYFLEGQRFGNLLVIKLEKIEKNNLVYYKYKCQCDCGEITYVNPHDLYFNKIKSCGCQKINYFLKSKNKIGILPALNQLYYQYNIKAKRRNLIFLLTKDEFNEIIKKNCYYCDIEPKQIFIASKTKYILERHKIIYNGIDRIDNTVGYILENCVPCCEKCNFMKGTLSEKEFLEHIKKISERMKNGARIIT